MKTKSYNTFWNTKILEFNQYHKGLAIIYVDIQCLINKIDARKNNPKKLSVTKVGEHILSGYSMSTILEFDGMKNKQDVCKSKGCVKKFFKSLTQRAVEIIIL